VTGSRGIAAGVGPAHRNGEVATLTGGLAHDVSILLGIGRHLGSRPGAKVSITIIRPPQRAQGQRSTRGVSVAISGGSCGSGAGEATLRSAPARCSVGPSDDARQPVVLRQRKMGCHDKPEAFVHAAPGSKARFGIAKGSSNAQLPHLLSPPQALAARLP
jgi:hypothetical protein